MSTTVYSRTDHNLSHEEGRGHGLLVLTLCSNGVGKGTRLELYASTGDDCPVEIRDPDEAVELASELLAWAEHHQIPMKEENPVTSDPTPYVEQFIIRFSGGHEERVTIDHRDPLGAEVSELHLLVRLRALLALDDPNQYAMNLTLRRERVG
jgi:hypothetical protein